MSCPPLEGKPKIRGRLGDSCDSDETTFDDIHETARMLITYGLSLNVTKQDGFTTLNMAISDIRNSVKHNSLDYEQQFGDCAIKKYQTNYLATEAAV